MMTDRRVSSFEEVAVISVGEVISVVSGMGVVLMREKVALRRQRNCDVS